MSSKKVEKVRVITAARAVIIENHKILLVSDHGKYWYTPGGWLDGFETLNDACKREVHEELGIDIEVGRLIKVDHQMIKAEYSSFNENLNKINHFFECKALTMPKINGDKNLWHDEDGGLVQYAKWFTMEDLSSVMFNPHWIINVLNNKPIDDVFSQKALDQCFVYPKNHE